MSLEEVRVKVRKLFTLAMNAGATLAEAALAAEKAQALLEEHKLSRADIPDASERVETAEHACHKVQVRCPHWRRVLRKACAETSGCFSMAGNAGEWHVFGKATDIAFTVELYHYLAAQVERFARDYMRHGRELHGKGAGVAFRVGCASRIGWRLRDAYRARQAARPQSQALAIYDEGKAARALSLTLFPNQSSGRHAPVRDSSAYGAGVSAGELARLTPERPLGTTEHRRLT